MEGAADQIEVGENRLGTLLSGVQMTDTETQKEWEDVASPYPGDYTERLCVPGGWLYRTWIQTYSNDENGESTCVAMVFVPHGNDVK